jgi:hypothetical protein
MSLVVWSYEDRGTAESYISVLDSDSLNSNTSHNATWDSLDTSSKEQFLKMATERIDFFGINDSFVGSRTYTDSLLRFPRVGIPSDDGRSFDAYTIPSEIKKVTAEVASFISVNNIYELDESVNVTREKIGSIEVEYSGKAKSSNDLLNDRINNLMLHFLKSNPSNMMVVR